MIKNIVSKSIMIDDNVCLYSRIAITLSKNTRILISLILRNVLKVTIKLNYKNHMSHMSIDYKIDFCVFKKKRMFYCM